MNSMGPWEFDIPASIQPVFDAAEPSDIEAAKAQAGFLLWAMSGRVFTLVEQTVRPCFGPPQRPAGGSTYGGFRSGPPFWPSMTVGDLSVAGSCGCATDCRHLGPTDLQLPGPVESVISVHIDGELLDASAYKIASHRWVRRTDGKVWPQNQNLNAGDLDDGAFTVKYEQGIPVPTAGQLAGAYLAADILRGMSSGSAACKLPPGVTSISRQGTSMDIDPREFFGQGLTGIEAVDQWIMLVNPTRSERPAQFISPDDRPPVSFR